MPDTYIDLMTATPGALAPSRWDRAGPATLHTLDDLLAKAGLPGRLEPARKLLDQGERLFDLARQQKDAAADRLERARLALRTDEPAAAAAAHARVSIETGPWVGDQPATMFAVMNEGHALQSNAVHLTLGLVPDLYRQLSAECSKVVDQIAQVKPLPATVWASATSGQASTAAIRAGHEQEWAALVRLGVKWDDIHSCAQLLRESGVLASELMFPAGCPQLLGSSFLNWQPALEGGLEQVQRFPGPLRVRAAHDRGWRPGLWLKSDHERELAAARPRPSLLARLGVGSKAEQTDRVEAM